MDETNQIEIVIAGKIVIKGKKHVLMMRNIPSINNEAHFVDSITNPFEHLNLKTGIINQDDATVYGHVRITGEIKNENEMMSAEGIGFEFKVNNELREEFENVLLKEEKKNQVGGASGNIRRMKKTEKKRRERRKRYK
jgi:hypothetical protein